MTYVANFNLDYLDAGPGAKVVDIGCGDGLFSRELARHGYRVKGVEPEAYLRKKFAAWATAERLPATVVRGTAERLPFRSGTVRTAVITEVLEHVDDPRPAVAEIFRVMAPGGTLCVSVPTSRTERVYWKLHPGYEANSTHRRIFTKDQLLQLLAGAGFEVRRVEGRNFVPALSWVFHALLRSQSDHAGKIKNHTWVDRGLDGGWRGLRWLRLEGPVTNLGNRLFPKSWYVYCRKPV